MFKQKYKHAVKNCFLIISGCAVYAVGIGLFLEPNGLTPAGVSGLAIIINRALSAWFGIKPPATGTVIIALNLPVMAIGIFKFGTRFFFSTVFATLLSSSFINQIEAHITPPTDELLLASILGGAFMSFGMGLVFKAGATTGGTDVAVRLLRTKYKHIRTGQIYWVTDGIVVLLSALTLGSIDILLYAIITLAVQTFVLNTVLYGSDGAALVYIISKREKAISEALSKDCGAETSLLERAESGESVMLCVVGKRRLPLLKELVACTDKNSFVIVTKAGEIIGKGFKSHGADYI